MRFRRRKQLDTICPTHRRPLDKEGRCAWDKEIEKRLMPIRMFNVGDRVEIVDAEGAREIDGVWDPVDDGDLGTVTDVIVRTDLTSLRVKLDRHPRNLGMWYDRTRVAPVDVTPQIVDDAVTLDGVTLNPDDPFERVIADIVTTNRRKRSDYALDGSPWSNFDDTANALGIDGFSPVDSANFNIEQKSARLRSLRKNGRMGDPANESVADTYLDRAVYSVIAYAMFRYPNGKVD